MVLEWDEGDGARLSAAPLPPPSSPAATNDLGQHQQPIQKPIAQLWTIQKPGNDPVTIPQRW